MGLAKWLAGFDEKSLALQVFLAESTVKALAVVIVVEGLNPPISGLNWESARHTLCGEQFVPIFFAVGKVVFQVEWRVGKYLSTIGANKTLWMERLAHCLQTILMTDDMILRSTQN